MEKVEKSGESYIVNVSLAKRFMKLELVPVRNYGFFKYSLHWVLRPAPVTGVEVANPVGVAKLSEFSDGLTIRWSLKPMQTIPLWI